VVRIHPAVPTNSLKYLMIEGAPSAQTTVRICIGSKQDPKIFFVENGMRACSPSYEEWLYVR
jgi:hypothetical protein